MGPFSILSDKPVKLSHVALRNRVVMHANEGRSVVATAELLGISKHSVIAFLDEAQLLRAKVRAAKPPKPPMPRKPRDRAKGVEIPGWVVKAKLDQDFSDVARERGEHAAAAHCRALLRDMRASA